MYCGEQEVTLNNGQKMKLQAACDQMNGAGKTIGICVGNDVTCSKVCQKADVGKTVPVCDIYGTTAGGEAPFAGQAVCTDLYDGTHYGLVEDDSTFKNCKNACNTEGTASPKADRAAAIARAAVVRRPILTLGATMNNSKVVVLSAIIARKMLAKTT